MNLRTSTALALCLGVGFSLSILATACGSSDSGTSDGAGGSTNEGSGGSSSASGGNGSTSVGGKSGASGGSSNAAGGATATGPGVWVPITVALNPVWGSTTVANASFLGSPVDRAPLPELFKTSKTVGDCKLVEPAYYLCDAPACDTQTELCTGDNQCETLPLNVDAGTWTVKGLSLTAGGTEATPVVVNHKYQLVGMAYPPCTAGSEVSIAGGDSATAFTVKTKCIDPMAVPAGTTSVDFAPNKAAAFAWTPSSASGARVNIEIDISHHGGLKGYIRCDTADTGSLSVDASLVTALINLGTAGFPVARVKRINTGTAAAGSGQATVNIVSQVELTLSIPGLTSCSSNADCGSGTCGDDLKCK